MVQPTEIYPSLREEVLLAADFSWDLLAVHCQRMQIIGPRKQPRLAGLLMSNFLAPRLIVFWKLIFRL